MTLFVSQSIEQLADRLDEQLLPGFAKQTILVPNQYLKKWLLLALAVRRGIALGLQIFTPSEWLMKQGFMSPNSLEMSCLIYRSLEQGKDKQLAAYLEKEGRQLDLTEVLSGLFFEYGQFGETVFAEKEGWQAQILKNLFVQGPWKLPVQWLSAAPVSEQKIHCFAIDSLPPLYWEWLLRFSAIAVYLFSPCLHYWGDICSDRERNQRLRYWRRQEVSASAQAQLEMHLSQGPSLLGNWGRVGRETLKILDSWELEVEESYEEREESSLLRRLQGSLLTFRSGPPSSVDGSIQIVRAGASIHAEVAWLQDEILRLVVENGLQWNEVAVLAPQIDAYALWIPFLFREIPYRIYGVDEAAVSPFLRGLMRMAELAKSRRWSRKEVFSLLESGAFARRQNWGEEQLEALKSWLQTVEWGWDGQHRKEVLENFLPGSAVGGEDSWEAGIDALLDRIAFFKEGFQVDCDLLEEFLVVFESLKKDLREFWQDGTLAEWADRLEKIAANYLFAHPDEDEAGWNFFRQFLMQLRQSNTRLGEEPFPFALVERFLLKKKEGEMHGSQLHAVRIAPLKEASLLSAKALFIVGMDEESFPAKDRPSSLSMLKKAAISAADLGRYHLLQTIFAASEFLRISYCHLSGKDGKEVGPALPLQELLKELPQEVVVTLSASHCKTPSPPFWLQEKPSEAPLPQGEVVIAVRDLSLLARHPWKFYLQKTSRLFLEDERKDSFASLKARCLRASLQKPLEEIWEEEKIPRGPIGEALRLEMRAQRDEWEEWLEAIGATSLTTLQLENVFIDVTPHLRVQIVGEIANVSPRGLVSTSDDHLESMLKAWPEALLVALIQNTPEVLCLKNAKTKAVGNPQESLRQFIEYYFQALGAPSPLLPDWADGLLRRGPEVLEKKRRGTRLEDPVLDWVEARYQNPSSIALCNGWSPFLQKVFAPLVALYPIKGKKHAEV